MTFYLHSQALYMRDQVPNLRLVLVNKGRKSINVSQVVFSFRHALAVMPDSAVQSMKRAGDLIFLTVDEVKLLPGKALNLDFEVQMPTLWRLSDLPAAVRAITPENAVIETKMTGPKSTYEFEPRRAVSELCLIPRPQTIEREGEPIPFPRSFDARDLTLAERNWICRLAQRFNVDLVLSNSGFPLVVEVGEADDGIMNLVLDSHQMLVRVRPQERAAGLATLAQILLQWPQIGALSGMRIKDRPGFDYRGLMLDTVRHFGPFKDLDAWIDLALLLKISHLHLHLSDDEGWRVEIPMIPELHQRAGFRGFDKPLPPHFGVSTGPTADVYEAAPLRETVMRAKDLGLTLIPEIDIPAHCRALLRALPHLQEAGDNSRYRTVQFFRDNVLCPVYPGVMNALRTILDSLIDTFAPPLVHLGGDEVPVGAWQGSEVVKTWQAQRRKAEKSSDLQTWLFSELSEYLALKGCRVGFWDDAVPFIQPSSGAQIYAWQGRERELLAVRNGHDLILCPATAAYFDHPPSLRRDDPGANWAQGQLTFNRVANWKPLEAWPKSVPKDKVRGVQSCLWTEVVSDRAKAEFMLFPRLLAFADVAWSGARLLEEGFDPLSECEAQAFAGWLAQADVKTRARSLGW